MGESQENDQKIDGLVENLIIEHIDEQMGDTVDKSAFYEELITEEILKKYDQNGQLKEELIDKIAPSVKAKVKDRIRISRKKQISQKVEDMEEDNIGELDESKKARIEGELEEKIESKEKVSSGGLDIHKEVLVAMYEQMMQEYYGLRDRINNGYNGRALTGELTSGSRIDVELVMYQNYLRKIDTNYKCKYGSFIAQDNKDLAKLEDSLRHFDAKSEQKVNQVMSENIQAAAVIIYRINELAEDIVRISSNPSVMDDSTRRELNSMQEEYILLTCQLNSLNPSLLELHEQMEQKEQVSQFKDRVIGTEYEKIHNRNAGFEKTNVIEDGNNKRQDDQKEDFNRKSHEAIRGSLDIADDLLKEFEDKIEKSPQKAMKNLESAELIVEGSNSLNGDSRQRRIDNATENYGKYSLQAECAAATKPDEEILKADVEYLKQRAAKLRDKINEKRRENNDMII